MNQRIIKRGHTSHIPLHTSNKGITLVALVITIIVLLILAGVTINMVLGDDGIIQNAQQSSIITELKQMQELVSLELANKKLEVGQNFNVNIYGTLESLGIESKYSNYIGISNGRMYVTSNAEEKVKEVARGTGIEVADQMAVTETNAIVLTEGKSIKNYKIYGSTTNVGDEEEGKGYKIPITVSGKNLLNAKLWSEGKLSNSLEIKYLEDEEAFWFNGTASKDTEYYGVYVNIPVSVNEKITISNTYVSGSVTRPDTGDRYALIYLGTSDTPNSSTNFNTCSFYNENNSKTATLNKSYISRVWFTISKDVVFDNYKVKIQIEKGETATPYEAYVEPVTYDIYLDKPLRSNGTVADYIDFARQKVVRLVGENNETLTTPEEEDIALPVILTNDGTSIITVGTTVVPSKIEIEY